MQGDLHLLHPEHHQQHQLQIEVEGQKPKNEVERVHHDLEEREEAPVRDPHGRVLRLVFREHLQGGVRRVAHADRRKHQLRRAEEEDEEEAEERAAAGEQRLRLARRLLDLSELLARRLGELDEDLVDLALDGCVRRVLWCVCACGLAGGSRARRRAGLARRRLRPCFFSADSARGARSSGRDLLSYHAGAHFQYPWLSLIFRALRGGGTR